MNGQMADRTGPFGWWRLLMAALLGALAHVSWSWHVGANPDDYFQIGAGRWILGHGFPTVDVVSWASASVRPAWVAHEWLYQVTMAGLHSIGGFTALLIWTLTAATAVLFLAGLWAWQRSGSWRTAVSTVLIAAAVSSLGYLSVLQMRPQTTSLALLLATAVLLEKGGKWRWGMVPLIALLANWHGGFWPLFALLVLYFAVRDRKPFLPAVLLALLANPYGVGILGLPFHYAGSTADYSALVGEWAPTVLWPGAPTGLVPFLAFLLVAIAVLAIRRFSLADAGLLVALLLLALSGLRYVIFVPLLGFPLLAGYRSQMAEAWPRERLGRWPLVAGFIPLFLSVILPMLVLLMSAAIQMPMRAPQQDLEYRTVSPGLADTNAFLDYAEEEGTARVFNADFGMGGYLYFAGLQPLIDNRTDIYLHRQEDGSRLWDEYTAALRDPIGLRLLVSKYEVEHVLAYQDSTVTHLMELEPGRYMPEAEFGESLVLFRVIEEGPDGQQEE